MEYNKVRVYHIPVFNTGGGNGSPGDGVLLASDLGDWLDLPEKSLNIFDEQINIQYKLDMMSYPDKAILFLAGQFGLKSDFVGSELILGVLPLNTRPKHQLKQNFTCQSTECYLVIELNGEVKLQAVSGDLPVTVGVSEPDPYFINVDYNPKIEDENGGETFTAIRTQNFTRNNCAAGSTGTSVTFEKTYTSTVSQADANNQRANDANFASEGQAWANDPANGATCVALPVFTATRTESFTRSNCADGLIPGSVNFTKPYTSTISQADADSKAAADASFATEGQAFANDPVNGATCSLPAQRYYAQRTQSFTRNNCASGSTGSAVNYTKNYQSDISQADADNKASTDPNFASEGQAFANDPANGATCTITVTPGYYLYLASFNPGSDPTSVVRATLTDPNGNAINAPQNIQFNWSLKINGNLQSGTATISAGTSYWPVWEYDTASDIVTDLQTSNPAPNQIGNLSIITG